LVEIEAKDPNRQLRWKLFPPGLRKPTGLLVWFGPDKQPVGFAQPPAFAQVRWPTLVEPQNAMDTAAQQPGHDDIGAKTSVGYHHISRPELIQQAPP
jgi:hypothetical protein